MKSIRSKIILLILTGIMVSVTIIGGMGILSFNQAIDNDSVKIMNLTCDEKTQELNNVFGRIEQSVEIMSVYTVDNLESIERISTDSKYAEQYIQNISELGLTIGNETDGAVAIYARFNPQFTNSTAGFFWVRDLETGTFQECELTDLSKYTMDDMEHVGWYYLPVKTGKAIWMQPYYNENIDVYMISYVIPIYKENELLGVVGMDIDFNYIIEKLDSIKVYETGEAFLADENFEIIYSKSHADGTLVKDLSARFAVRKDADFASSKSLYDYTLSGVKKKAAFMKLENSMYLVVTAPVSEIESNKNRLILQSVTIEFLAVIIFVCIAWGIARTIVRPLKELDIAAKEIARGNLDVPFSCKSKDEVGTLAESLRETANQLKVRIDYINNLAYIDKLTGIMNNTAYLQEVSVINENIDNIEVDFSVFVIDVNGLKDINDTYGHDYGNRLIINASKILTGVFGFENVYRIGGDEFAVIMESVGDAACKEFVQKFEKMIKTQNGEIKVAAAIGNAVFDKNMDNSYESVFKRADGEMYKRKLEMKLQGENSEVKGQEE